MRIRIHIRIRIRSRIRIRIQQECVDVIPRLPSPSVLRFITSTTLIIPFIAASV